VIIKAVNCGKGDAAASLAKKAKQVRRKKMMSRMIKYIFQVPFVYMVMFYFFLNSSQFY